MRQVKHVHVWQNIIIYAPVEITLNGQMHKYDYYVNPPPEWCMSCGAWRYAEQVRIPTMAQEAGIDD